MYNFNILRSVLNRYLITFYSKYYYYVLLISMKFNSLMISTPRALELFVSSLLKKTGDITIQKNARTLTLTHL